VHPDRRPHEDRLRALEAAGTPITDLIKALMDAYHECFPSFISLSQGLRRRDQISPNNPEMGLWALTIFEDGWRVLTVLGTTSDGLVNHLRSHWPPAMWMDDAELLRVPNTRIDPILQALKAHGIPVTRRNYIALMDPGADPDNLHPELELELPVELRASFDPGE
jgi:hypothetical protein